MAYAAYWTRTQEETARGVSPFQSDPKQPKPTPLPVSTVKPTEYEKGATSSPSTGTAAKPVTPAAAASAPPPVAAAGTVPVTTVGAGLSAAAKVSAGASQPSATGGRPTGAAGSTSTQSGASKVASQAPPARAPQASAGSGVTGGAGVGAAGGGVAGKHSTSPVKPKDAAKDKAQSTAIPPSKSEPPKATSTGTVKASATAGVSVSAAPKDGAKSKEAKVSADDPFDALADSLPSSDPVAPTAPQYTGPEVKERDIDSEEAKRCGDRDDTLPPGYRRQDMEKKIPAGVPEKPEEQPKPITTDEALESLSAGFVSSEVSSTSKPGLKAENVDPVKVHSSYAPPPPPQKKQEVSGPASKSPAAPADKKAKVEIASPVQSAKPKTDKVGAEGPTPVAKAGAPEKKITVQLAVKPKEHPKPSLDDAVDSLSAGFVSSSAPKVETPSLDDAVDSLSAGFVSSSAPKVETGDSMSLDALDVLGDMLPDSQPAAEIPAPRPEDIVDERKLDPEKGVLVGEREDSIPPEYRFSKEDLKKYPAPPKEPSLDPGEALDILSDDFTSSAAAPVVQASVPPSAPPKQVACGVPSALAQVTKSTVSSTSEGEPMSLDALSALEDTLPVAQPTPEPPKLRPEDIVDERKLTSEKGVRVGERDDTLPPDYRFPEADVPKVPAPPQKEPSMDTDVALDILSGDFSNPAEASADCGPLPPSAPPADSSADFAIEELAGDFVAPTAVSKIHSAAPAPPTFSTQVSEGAASAMDALGDTLMDVSTAPEPAPVAPKDIVKEKEAVEEHVSKPGERDDSIPREYWPTEADIKAAAEAKARAAAKRTSMDESAALDVLSSDFSAPAAPVVSPACPPHGPAAKTPPSKMAPETAHGLPESKPKDGKPKKPAVTNVSTSDDNSSKMSTDMVSTSSPKKGGKI